MRICISPCLGLLIILIISDNLLHQALGKKSNKKNDKDTTVNNNNNNNDGDDDRNTNNGPLAFLNNFGSNFGKNKEKNDYYDNYYGYDYYYDDYSNDYYGEHYSDYSNDYYSVDYSDYSNDYYSENNGDYSNDYYSENNGDYSNDYYSELYSDYYGDYYGEHYYLGAGVDYYSNDYLGDHFGWEEFDFGNPFGDPFSFSSDYDYSSSEDHYDNDINNGAWGVFADRFGQHGVLRKPFDNSFEDDFSFSSDYEYSTGHELYSQGGWDALGNRDVKNDWFGNGFGNIFEDVNSESDDSEMYPEIAEQNENQFGFLENIFENDIGEAIYDVFGVNKEPSENYADHWHDGVLYPSAMDDIWDNFGVRSVNSETMAGGMPTFHMNKALLEAVIDGKYDAIAEMAGATSLFEELKDMARRVLDGEMDILELMNSEIIGVFGQFIEIEYDGHTGGMMYLDHDQGWHEMNRFHHSDTLAGREGEMNHGFPDWMNGGAFEIPPFPSSDIWYDNGAMVGDASTFQIDKALLQDIVSGKYDGIAEMFGATSLFEELKDMAHGILGGEIDVSELTDSEIVRLFGNFMTFEYDGFRDDMMNVEHDQGWHDNMGEIGRFHHSNAWVVGEGVASQGFPDWMNGGAFEMPPFPSMTGDDATLQTNKALLEDVIAGKYDGIAKMAGATSLFEELKDMARSVLEGERQISELLDSNIIGMFEGFMEFEDDGFKNRMMSHENDQEWQRERMMSHELDQEWHRERMMSHEHDQEWHRERMISHDQNQMWQRERMMSLEHNQWWHEKMDEMDRFHHSDTWVAGEGVRSQIFPNWLNEEEFKKPPIRHSDIWYGNDMFGKDTFSHIDLPDNAHLRSDWHRDGWGTHHTDLQASDWMIGRSDDIPRPFYSDYLLHYGTTNYGGGEEIFGSLSTFSESHDHGTIHFSDMHYSGFDDHLVSFLDTHYWIHHSDNDYSHYIDYSGSSVMVPGFQSVHDWHWWDHTDMPHLDPFMDESSWFHGEWYSSMSADPSFPPTGFHYNDNDIPMEQYVIFGENQRPSNPSDYPSHDPRHSDNSEWNWWDYGHAHSDHYGFESSEHVGVHQSVGMNNDVGAYDGVRVDYDYNHRNQWTAKHPSGVDTATQAITTKRVVLTPSSNQLRNSTGQVPTTKANSGANKSEMSEAITVAPTAKIHDTTTTNHVLMPPPKNSTWNTPQNMMDIGDGSHSMENKDGGSHSIENKDSESHSIKDNHNEHRPMENTDGGRHSIKDNHNEPRPMENKDGGRHSVKDNHNEPRPMENIDGGRHSVKDNHNEPRPMENKDGGRHSIKDNHNEPRPMENKDGGRHSIKDNHNEPRPMENKDGGRHSVKDNHNEPRPMENKDGGRHSVKDNHNEPRPMENKDGGRHSVKDSHNEPRPMENKDGGRHSIKDNHNEPRRMENKDGGRHSVKDNHNEPRPMENKDGGRHSVKDNHNEPRPMENKDGGRHSVKDIHNEPRPMENKDGGRHSVKDNRNEPRPMENKDGGRHSMEHRNDAHQSVENQNNWRRSKETKEPGLPAMEEKKILHPPRGRDVVEGNNGNNGQVSGFSQSNTNSKPDSNSGTSLGGPVMFKQLFGAIGLGVITLLLPIL